MKRLIVFFIFIVLFNLYTKNGYCQHYLVDLRTSEKSIKTNLDGFRNLLSKINIQTGVEEIINLNDMGIFKPMDYFYDNKTDVIFIEEYFSDTYNIRIVNLTDHKLLKTIMLNSGPDYMKFVTNPVNGMLYVSYEDKTNGKIVTSFFNNKYDFVKTDTTYGIEGNINYFSKDGKIFYIVSFDINERRNYFLILNALTGDIAKKIELTSLAVKGEYARIRDGKEGKLLLEYRKNEEYENYVLYDPLEDKILSKLDKVQWHVGDVYLDDSLDNIVINTAILKDKGNGKKERIFLNKINVYSFKKGAKTKEISIMESTKIEAVKDKIYLRQNKKITNESIK